MRRSTGMFKAFSCAIPVLVWLVASCAPDIGTQQRPNDGSSVEGSGGVASPSAATIEIRSAEVVLAPAAMTQASEAKVDLQGIIRDSIEVIDEALGLPPVSVRVDVGGPSVIPEVGIGGYANSAFGDVSISIAEGADPKVYEVWLPKTLAHELHHSRRIIEGPGYKGELAGALVTEGLADLFSLETFGGPRPPWIQKLSPAEFRKARRALDRELRDGLPYDHGAWFFGRGDLPRWTGYRLGFELTSRYLSRNDVSPAEAFDVPARTVLSLFRGT